MNVNDLRNGRDKAQVAFTEFSISTRNKENFLFCFFEGKDNPYYVPRIRNHTPFYVPIKCGGKQSLLDVYKLISNNIEYTKYKCGFFIDRDFNKRIGDLKPPIFETPCYSIENFYVSINVFKEILLNEFGISELNKQFTTLLTLYENRQTEFHQSVLLFNSWYSCLVEIKEKENIEICVMLDDKLPKDFVTVTLEKVISNYDFTKIKETFPNAIPIEYSIVEQKMTLLKNTEMYKEFRGKYELDFLLKMIKEILKDKSIKFAFGDGSGLNQQQALNIFQTYAETPESLNEYLKIVLK